MLVTILTNSCMYLFKNSKKDSWASWAVCIPAALFFFFDFLQMAVPNSIKVDIQNYFNIPESKAMYVANAFSLGNFLFVFPAAIIVDRYPTRKVLLASLPFSFIGALGMAISNCFFSFCLSRFLSGAAHAFCFLCCVSLVQQWFSPKKIAFAMGVVVAIGCSGALFANIPFVWLLHNTRFTWQELLLGNSLLILLTWLIAFVCVHPFPSAEKQDTQKKETWAAFFASMKQAFKNRQNWLYALFIPLINLPYSVIALVYMNEFLVRIHQVTQETASALTTAFFLGNILGAPLANYISEKWSSRKKPMCVGALSTLVCLVMLLFLTPLPTAILWILLPCLGLFISAQVISYPAITEMNPPSIVGRAMSITSFLFLGSIFMLQSLTPWIFSMFCAPEVQRTKIDYIYGFSHVLLGLIGALVLIFFLKETHKNAQENKQKHNKT